MESDEIWHVPVSAADPTAGPVDALVTLVVFSDFECPHCRRAAGVMEALLGEFPRDLRLVWKDDPLPRHSYAERAALFARAARKQRGEEGFWAAHDALYESQPELGDTELERIATRLGIDWTATKAALDGKTQLSEIHVGMDLSRSLGLRVTPTSFINGRRLEGARPLPELRKAVERALEEATRAIQAGTPRRDYYARHVAKGRRGETR